MIKVKIPYAYRSATETDRNLILQSWLRTWRDENKNMRTDAFYAQAHSLFESILDKFGAIVACNVENPDQVYGFAVAAYLSNNDWVLFWIQTKGLYSKLGIGKGMFSFLKGNRTTGPICPFIRNKTRKYMKKYDLLHAPMMIVQIMAMEDAVGKQI